MGIMMQAVLETARLERIRLDNEMVKILEHLCYQQIQIKKTKKRLKSILREITIANSKLNKRKENLKKCNHEIRELTKLWQNLQKQSIGTEIIQKEELKLLSELEAQ